MTFHIQNFRLGRHTFKNLEVKERASLTLFGAYWDEGSRYSYQGIRLSDGMETLLPKHGGAPQFGGTAPTVELTPGVAIVQDSVFCGKIMNPVMYVTPTDYQNLFTKFGPEIVDLTPQERIVLRVTQGFKSAYRLTESGLSKAAFEEIKQGLITRGLLNKNGSIGTKGRNALLAEKHG